MARSELVGTVAFLKGLRMMPPALQEDVIRKANAGLARELRAETRGSAPFRTGFLRRNIRVATIRRSNNRVRSQGFTHLVGTGLAFYGRFIELGTEDRTHKGSGKSVGRLIPRPFFSEAIDRQAAKGVSGYLGIYQEELKRVEKKYGREFFQLSPAEKRRLARS